MIPNFPTDNLYKFLALGGLALAGFGFWASWNIERDLQKDEVAARDQIVTIYSDFDALINRLASTFKSKNPVSVEIVVPKTNSKGEVVDLFRPAPGARLVVIHQGKQREDYRGVLSFLDRHLRSYLPHNEAKDAPPVPNWEGKDRQVSDLREKIRQHGLAVEGLWSRLDSETPYSKLFFSLAWIGLVISVAGFALWYFFVQRFQDTLTRLQIEKARKDLADSK